MSDCRDRRPVGDDGRSALWPWAGGASAPALQAIASLLTPISFSAGQVLQAAGEPAGSVYLLEAGAVTLSVPGRGGEALGVQVASRGDLLGLETVFDRQPSRTNAVALVAGRAMRVGTPLLAKTCKERPELGLALTAALARQHGALQLELACCRRHDVGERLARLLHELSERLGTKDLPLTQEQLALFLGVQRTTVTALAGRLKACGAVTTRRGALRIVDRVKLAAAACGCA